MNYTIGELSKIMNVSIHTLRYYDNEGLLPFVQRKPNGQRIFTHRDLIFLNTIRMFKIYRYAFEGNKTIYRMVYRRYADGTAAL